MTTSTNPTPALPSTSDTFSGVQKAAVFLLGMGDHLSSAVLRQLDPPEIRAITAEIRALEAVAPKRMLAVFREFDLLSASGRFFARGGAGTMRKMIEQALGPETAGEILDPPGIEPAKPRMEFLDHCDPQQVAHFLKDENPQTIALVLSNISPRQAAAVMAALQPELQPQVAMRMASLDRISPEVFERISEAIGVKLRAAKQMSRSDGVRTLAGLLNQIEPGKAEAILSKVDAENQTLGASVRELMFTFDDIIKIGLEGMKSIVAKVDRKALTTALKGCDARVRAHFTQCMSQRAAEMMTEDMEALGPVRIRDVRAAQQQVVAVVRQLQQQGAISTGSGGDDEYVV